MIVRHLFGFTDATLIAGVVDSQHCTRCDAAEVETYLATLI